MAGLTVRRPGRRILAWDFWLPVLPAVLALAFLPVPASAASPAWVASTAPTTGLSPAAGAPASDGAALGRVACLTVGSCTAVGHYLDSSSHVQGLIETLSGGSWAAATAPLTGLTPAPGADPGARLLDLSCPSPGSCAAAGTYTDSAGHQEGLIEAQSGGSWAATTAPTVAASQLVRLPAISCPAAGSCVAVGGYQDTTNTSHALIETLSNGTWTAATVVTSGLSPAGANASLNTVSCPASGSCVATGSYLDSAHHRQGLIATLAAGTWTAIAAPVAGLNPAPGASPLITLLSLSCPAPGSCAAVGYYVDASAQEDGLIESLASGTWTAATAPVTGLSPARGASQSDIVNLGSVSCPAAGSCVAVGEYNDASDSRHGLAETLASGSWSAATMPAAGLTPAALYVNSVTDISCPAAGSCAATGTYQDVSGNEHGLMETQAGGIWTAATAPVSGLNPPPITSANPSLPPYLVPVTPYSVTCPANGSCLAVGDYEDAGESLHGLVETLTNAPVPSSG